MATLTVGDPAVGDITAAIDPTDVGFDVIVIAGQSNAAGSNTDIDTTNFDVTDPRLWVFPSGGNLVNQIVQAKDPLRHHGGATGVGPAMPFARDYLRIIPANRKVLLVPVAHGGTNFHTTAPNWDPSTGLLYSNMIEQANLALEAAGENSRLVAIIWCQGESSAQPAEFDNYDYETDLDGLIDQVRTDLSEVPFLLLQIVPENVTDDYNGQAAGKVAINAVHIDTPRRKLLTSFTYGAEGYRWEASASHYTAAGQRINGQRLVAGFQRAVENVLNTAPRQPDAPVLTQSGTDVGVVWEHPGGRVTDYDVRWREVGDAWTDLVRAQSIDLSAVITGTTNGDTYEAQVRAVNEEGDGEWSESGTIETVVAPGQVTGLALDGTLTTQAPLAWNAVAGADYYRLEKKLHADPTWDDEGDVTEPEGTIGGLLELSEYDFRVTAVNAAGDGTPSATLTDTTPEYEKLFAMTQVAFEGWSIARDMRSVFPGEPLVRVRRSLDDAELDIGVSAGALDETALLAFVGGNDGFVSVLYDQSSSYRDLIQPAPESQPQIVSAGTVIKVNGKPSMLFDGVDDFLYGAFEGLYDAGECTVAGVLAGSPLVNNARVFMEGSTTDDGVYALFMASGTTGKIGTYLKNDANVVVIAQTTSPGAVALDDTLHQFSVVDTGSGLAISRRVDGGVASSITSSRSGAVTLGVTVLGARLDSTGASIFYAGYISELVTWAEALDNTDRAAVEDDQQVFYGTP